MIQVLTLSNIIFFLWKFVLTEEESLLDHAILEVKKLLSAEINKGKDEEYLNSLICSTDCNGNKKELSLVQAIFWSMSFWCDNKLQDYHLHFSQVISLDCVTSRSFFIVFFLNHCECCMPWNSFGKTPSYFFLFFFLSETWVLQKSDDHGISTQKL